MSALEQQPAPVSTDVRLCIADTAERLFVSLAEMSFALRISKTAVFDATRRNVYARRCDPAALQARLCKLMREKGATELELQNLFTPSPNNRKRRAHSTPVEPDAPESEPTVLLLKQTLSPQARKHFKLFSNPFDGPVQRDEQFFEGREFLYVRETAWQCAKNSSFVAVVGESGAGKSTIQADLEERLAKYSREVVVIKPSVLGMEETNRKGQVLKSADLLHAIISALDGPGLVPSGMQARSLRAQQLLASSTTAGNSHLLVVEEAHGMPDATLKHMKRMHELRAGRRSLLGVLLLAQPELKVRLADGLRNSTLREVAQRCEVVDLLPLDAELRAYLECRAGAAGAKLDAIFEPAAVDQLRQRLTRKTQGGMVSLCYPLAANNMATRAMNLAAEIGVPVVTSDVIKAI